MAQCRVFVHDFGIWMPLVFYRLQKIGLQHITSQMSAPTSHFEVGPTSGSELSFFAGLWRRSDNIANKKAWKLKDTDKETTELEFLRVYFDELSRTQSRATTALGTLLTDEMTSRNRRLQLNPPSRADVQSTARYHSEQSGHCCDDESFPNNVFNPRDSNAYFEDRSRAHDDSSVSDIRVDDEFFESATPIDFDFANAFDQEMHASTVAQTQEIEAVSPVRGYFCFQADSEQGPEHYYDFPELEPSHSSLSSEESSLDHNTRRQSIRHPLHDALGDFTHSQYTRRLDLLSLHSSVQTACKKPPSTSPRRLDISALSNLNGSRPSHRLLFGHCTHPLPSRKLDLSSLHSSTQTAFVIKTSSSLSYPSVQEHLKLSTSHRRLDISALHLTSKLNLIENPPTNRRRPLPSYDLPNRSPQDDCANKVILFSL